MPHFYIPDTLAPNVEELVLKRKPPELHTRNTLLTPCLGCNVFLGYAYQKQPDGTKPCHPQVGHTARRVVDMSGQHMGDPQVCAPEVVNITSRIRSGR